MIKTAFNSLTRLHSKTAMLKRLGSPDIYSPARITPSNYFRFLRGPEYTTVKGVEFIIPKDTVIGQYSQKLLFNKVPDAGSFKITFSYFTTTSLSFDISAADMQVAVRLLTGFQDVLVTGDLSSGFIFIFQGYSSPIPSGVVSDSTLANGADSSLIPIWSRMNIPWDKLLTKGDRLIEGSNLWSVDEIIEMFDVGAILIGWRIRCD